MKIQILLLLLLAVSCTTKNKNELIPPQVLGEGKYLNSSKLVNRVLDIHFMGNKYIVNDPDGNYQLKIFDINNSEFEIKIAKTGEGPCEFSFPTFSQIIPNDTNSLGLYNARLDKYREIELSTDSYNCTGKERLRIASDFQRVIKINDTIFFGTGLFEKKYAVEYQNLKNYQQLEIDYPFVNANSDFQNFSIPMSQQGQLLLRPDGKYILTTSQFSPTFDIIEISNTNINLKYRFEGWPPEFTASENPNVISSSMTNNNKFGYISSSVSDQFIYLLFSGKTLNQDPFKSDLIQVFDWEGNKIKELNIPIEVTLIAVSPDDKHLITYHDDGKANLTRFKLD